MGEKTKFINHPAPFYIILSLQILSIPFIMKSSESNPLQWVWLFLFLWQFFSLLSSRKEKRYRGRHILRRSLKISLILIMIIAGSLRVFRIFSIPPGLWVDELYTAVNSLDLNTGSYWKNPFYMTPLVGEGWVETSNLYLYFVRFIWLFLGLSYFGMKMVSVLPGIFAVFFLYFLGRRVWGFRAGLAAAFFFAVNSWQITLSRWGWDEVLLTALQIPVFLFLWKGLRRGKAFDFAFSGFLLGLCLYTHAAARILVVFVLIYLFLEWFLSRNSYTMHYKGLGIFFLFFILCALPFGIYMFRNPQAFTARFREVSIFAQMRREDSVFPLISNIWNHLLMFHGTSDPNIRHHISGKPVMDIISGLFMIIGLLVTFLGLKRPKNRFILMWLFFGLLGGILSSSPGGPHTYRTGISGPPAFILCGIGLAWAIRISKGILEIQREKYLHMNIAIAILLILSLGINTRRYFISYPEEPRLWREFWGSEETLFAREIAQRQEMGEKVFLDTAFRSNYYFLYRATLRVIAGNIPEYFDPITRKPNPGSGKTDVFCPPFRKDFYEENLPGFTLNPVKNPPGEESLYYIEVDSEKLGLYPTAPPEMKQIFEITYYRDNAVIKREIRERLDLRDIPEQTKGIIIKTNILIPKDDSILFKLESSSPLEMSIDGTKREMNDKNEIFTPLTQGSHALEMLIREFKDFVNIRLLWRPHFKEDEEIPREFLSLGL